MYCKTCNGFGIGRSYTEGYGNPLFFYYLFNDPMALIQDERYCDCLLGEYRKYYDVNYSSLNWHGSFIEWFNNRRKDTLKELGESCI